MTDVFTKEKRGDVMSRIRATNTKPELVVRKYLFLKGFRYRIHQKNIKGKPDLVLKKYKALIFINGCFWHGHEAQDCAIARLPKSNVKYWKDKIDNNRNRDRKNYKNLEEEGWKIFTIWECSLRGRQKQVTLHNLVDKIRTLML
jgi:DNA mismatch endonuclease, patch repair protein